MRDTHKSVAELNDAFRRNPLDRGLGKLYVTDGIESCGPDFVAQAIAAVIAFDAFDADNDPWHEHDFGSIMIDDVHVFFKIHYYSKADPDLGSENPADPAVTERVMTIMLAEEY